MGKKTEKPSGQGVVAPPRDMISVGSVGWGGHSRIAKPDGSTRDSWHPYTCAHCGRDVSGAVVAVYLERRTGHPIIKWLQCINCGDGSVYTAAGIVHPPAPFGPKIEGLPDMVKDAYEEARLCMSVKAFTSSELICRTILMYAAVNKGANEGQSFVDYIDYLENKGFVTPPMKDWVDIIRQHGNKAVHSLDRPDEERAKATFMFTAELLRLIYEMEHEAKKYTTNP